MAPLPRSSAKPVAHYHVVSGCSGSGKSTLIAALAARGEQVVLEPGRRIVKEQLSCGGAALPWADAPRFVERCAELATRDFDRHRYPARRTFFDRSLVDIASAVVFARLSPPRLLVAALRSRRYAPTVFVSPPWKELFRSDSERRHDFQQALAEYEVLLPTYRRHGHEIVLLPRAPVDQRVDFVLSSLERSGALR